MSDIVERLRTPYQENETGAAYIDRLEANSREAADEIERLKALLNDAAKSGNGQAVIVQQQADRIERLEAENAKLHGRRLRRCRQD